MTRSEGVTQFWADFCATSDEVSVDEPYQVWYFSNTKESAVELAELVIAGKKTATASLAAVNELQPDVTPYEGGYSVVTDLDGAPKCVIRTVEVRQVPFDEVDPQFAFDEGEGDQSLEYWRDVHQSYFSREAAEFGVDFGPWSMICCERFRLLFPR